MLPAMTSAPVTAEWSPIVSAAKALLTQGLAMSSKSFLRAVRGLKAAATVLLFKLASAMADAVSKPHATSDKSRATAAMGRRPPSAPMGSKAGSVVWRNPPVTAYAGIDPRLPRPLRSPSPRAPSDPDQRRAKAMQTLKSILVLCAAPDRPVRRLARRIAATDHVLVAAFVKAIAAVAREKDRKTHEAWRFIQRDRRFGRRRRRKETG